MTSLQKYETDFHIYLVSNGSMELYPQNTAGNFCNELQVPIDFGADQDKWEVGVSELQIPATYFNVTEGNNILQVRYPKMYRKRPTTTGDGGTDGSRRDQKRRRRTAQAAANEETNEGETSATTEENVQTAEGQVEGAAAEEDDDFADEIGGRKGASAVSSSHAGDVQIG